MEDVMISNDRKTFALTSYELVYMYLSGTYMYVACG